MTVFIQCHIATFLLLLSAWVRYAGTVRSLSKHGAYTLIIIGQVRTPYPTLFLLFPHIRFSRHFLASRKEYTKFWRRNIQKGGLTSRAVQLRR
jgi:hypothetical protein